MTFWLSASIDFVASAALQFRIEIYASFATEVKEDGEL
jgi:hypothetical protein